MKLELCQLPLEVWNDVNLFLLKCIGRRRMAALVHLIGNQKFAEFLLFTLHDQGKVILDTHFIDRIPNVC